LTVFNKFPAREKEVAVKEVDPTGRDQRSVGAKVDGGKPTVMLCFTTMHEGLRQLLGQSLPEAESVEVALRVWGEVALDQMMRNAIDARGTLAALAILQSKLGKLPTVTRVDSLFDLVAQFPDALMDVSSLTGYGVQKYRAAGWQFVPNGQARYSESYGRHVLKAFSEERDQDSGYLHWCAVAWNGLAVMSMRSLNLGLAPSGSDTTAPGLAHMPDPAPAPVAVAKTQKPVYPAIEVKSQLGLELLAKWPALPASQEKAKQRAEHLERLVKEGKLSQLEADHIRMCCIDGPMAQAAA
jgi:hypothetical protein